MDDALFHRTVDQAAAMGFETLVLTPLNGDVFMDKNIIGRMKYIENSAIKFQIFYTNFIGADDAAIKSLLAMRKLSYMEISVYGHDPDSFQNITRRGRPQYDRLVGNLLTLATLLAETRSGPRVAIGIRTYRSFRMSDGISNDLLDAIEELRRLGAIVEVSSQVDNWGGDVNEADVADIYMDMTEGKYLYRKGPCARPFDAVQITADGNVNACACRDPRGLLTLGSATTQPLADILSPDNKKWTTIINDHDAGRFNSVCGNCGFYQSIYDHRSTQGDPPEDVMSREEYFSALAEGAVPKRAK